MMRLDTAAMLPVKRQAVGAGRAGAEELLREVPE